MPAAMPGSVGSMSGEEREGAFRRARIQWRLVDPVIATLARWADEDPAAMRRLVEDDQLRGQLKAAIRDVVGLGEEHAGPEDTARNA